MSDPVGVVKATYEAWNSGDWGLERFHPDVEFQILGGGVLDQAAPAQGRDVLLGYWRRFWGAWESGAHWLADAQRLEAGLVLATGHLRVVGRSSGIETGLDFTHLWTVRDGLIIRLLAGEDRDEVLGNGG
jgi:ketosteroid isomerase-like protein